MNYFDDMLNVNAYMRMKMKNNLQHSLSLLEGFEKLGKEYDDMNRWADNTFARLQEIAGQLKVDISEQEKRYGSAAERAIAAGCCTCADLRAKIPKDYDYASAFQQLCQEAHDAGFTDVHPEQLLTEEEILHAREYEAALDLQFETQTGLKGKDMRVVAIAVAVRVLCYVILKKFHNKKANQVPVNAETGCESGEDAGKSTLDALSGVDIDSLIKGFKSGYSGENTEQMKGLSLENFKQMIHDFPELLQQGDEIFSLIKGKKVHMTSIRSENEILHGPVPFDIPDNKYFKHSEIAGYNKFAGWIIGVLNILTDTVTTMSLESYSVSHVFPDGSLSVDEKISSVLHVLIPVVYNLPSYKDALLASVIREAGILNISAAPVEDMSALLDNVTYYEQENSELIKNVSDVASVASVDWGNVLGNTEMGSFLNKLIAAIHSVFYNPAVDGDLKMYAVRTNRVLLLSSGIAAAVDSIPAIISEDYTKSDWGGILTTVLNAFNSLNFWIEIKSQYLMSEYKAEIDKQIALLDEYIEYV